MRRYVLWNCIIFALIAGQSLNLPHQIHGRVFDSRGEVISGDNFDFQIYLSKNPADILTRDSMSCGYNPPVWYAELGNLKTLWSFGDSLVIILEKISPPEKIRFDWVIDGQTELPDLYLENFDVENIVVNFTMSDYGVFSGNPVSFNFYTSFPATEIFRLSIFDHNGTEVYRAETNSPFSAGQYRITWDGHTSLGKPLRSGIYYYFTYYGLKMIHSGVVTIKNE